VFVLLQLLPVSDRDKNAEISALRHRITVLKRQPGTTNNPDRFHPQRPIRDGMIPARVSTNSARGPETSGTKRK
jgi:hypothetical protein